MRANFRMQRLFVDAPLAAGTKIAAGRDQVNYLANVLRLADGDEILLFNGRDGEWRTSLSFTGRKALDLVVTTREREQTAPSELHYLFAPLKQARLDYMVQKATEMGAGLLQPVLTQHTQVQRLNLDRMQANVREAAEQCGILSIPACREPEKLDRLLDDWDESRRIIFCDESAETQNPLAALKAVREQRLAVLIGPEGGFSAEERAHLAKLPFVTAIPLGPRILRADTAAVAALSVVQAVCGDWR